MEKFEAPVELDNVELDAVAGGIFNDINVVQAFVLYNSNNNTVTDSSTSDNEAAAE